MARGFKVAEAQWWDGWRDVSSSALFDLAELGHHATAISTAQMAHLPGLMQTVEYARVIFRQSIPALPPPEVEYRVSHRIERQQIIYGDDPTPFKAIIHETAPRMQFGGRRVTRQQLGHIAELSEQPHITVLVIPYPAGIFPGAGQTVLCASGPVPQLDTLQLDSRTWT
ncbi:DUF5753 domain-containing protein [Streptomyces sp. NPDC018019]|uniref:DUF5753 domain-containing protein n=1 Tax=Streptomyces sp. NPDC018019 TaxID=3365030 RepID=UPI0037920DF4